MSSLPLPYRKRGGFEPDPDDEDLHCHKKLKTDEGDPIYMILSLLLIYKRADSGHDRMNQDVIGMICDYAQPIEGVFCQAGRISNSSTEMGPVFDSIDSADIWCIRRNEKDGIITPPMWKPYENIMIATFNARQ